ncbi:MAG: DUF167 domain-containing protein [Alphaproteobacteria bacterium]|nr:MAG: DUF167 domain-containing protein [Alphaproteobacteria bacterium]
MPWRRIDDGLELAVKVVPKAGRDAIAGVRADAAGSRRLLIRVSAAPEKGKANAAVIALLARALRLPKSAIAVIAGETAREKRLRIASADEKVIARLAALCDDRKA